MLPFAITAQPIEGANCVCRRERKTAYFRPRESFSVGQKDERFRFMASMHTSSRTRNILFAAVLALLWVRLVSIPTSALDTSLDISSQAADEYSFIHHYQWGADIIQNIGPFGFIFYDDPYYSNLVLSKILVGFLFSTILVILSYNIIKYSNQFNMSLIFFCTLIFGAMQDIKPYLFYILINHYLLKKSENQRSQPVEFLIILFSAFIFYAKGFCVVLSSVSMAFFCIRTTIEKKYVKTLYIASLYIVMLGFFDLLAHQELSNFTSYIKGVFSFADAYAYALAKYVVPGQVLFIAIAAILFVTLFSCRLLSYGKIEIRYILFFLVNTLMLYMAFKHSFNRGESRSDIFFKYFIFSTPIVLFFSHPGIPWPIRKFNERKLMLYFYAALSGISIAALFFSSHHSLFFDIAADLQAKARFFASPVDYLAGLKSELSDNEIKNRLPEIAHIIANEPVDYWGTSPGVVLLNGFHYRPRPMPIAFAAANAYLQEANLRFLSDPERSPRYFIVQMNPLDQRIASQEDSLAFLYLLYNYQPMIHENKYLLLRRRDSLVFPEIAMNGGELTCRINIPFIFPRVTPTDICIAKFNVELNWLGKLFTLLYKSPQIDLHWKTKSGAVGESGLVLTTATNKFMLSPIIYSNSNFLDAMHANAPDHLNLSEAEVELYTPYPAFLLFREKVVIEYTAVPGPEAMRNQDILQEWPEKTSSNERFSAIWRTREREAGSGLLQRNLSDA
ncbi:MAG: hypothetical protein HQK81_03620 [Desulfovibrionaceae bacterium]|nr:hypothetical protein [Desulfovibrionaceae bacterium]MBF0513131.1 hypothetical protein [Desulfovibrionaceae bacterium]